MPHNARSRRVMEALGFVYEREFWHDDHTMVLYRQAASARRTRAPGEGVAAPGEASGAAPVQPLMPKVVSAGLVMYRVRERAPRGAARAPRRPVLRAPRPRRVVDPQGRGGRRRRSAGAARREFAEETGLEPWGPYQALGAVKYKNHKVVHAWAFEGDFDPATLVSNTFELEWPRRSGRLIEVPEIDRAGWFEPR